MKVTIVGGCSTYSPALADGSARMRAARPIEELSECGGAFHSEAAVDQMASLINNGEEMQVVNVRNDGTPDFLPGGHVIEVPARVTAAGIQPEPLVPLDPEMRVFVAHVAGYERLALEAAVQGGRGQVLRALIVNPLVGQYKKAQKPTDGLLQENATHLAWTR